jgi:tetratricopeptide (TPR) repeat protein
LRQTPANCSAGWQAFIVVTGTAQIRWLSALLLLAALPAAPQAFLSSTDEHSATENVAAATESGDIPDVARAPEQPELPHLTPEQLGDIYFVRRRYMAAIREYQKIEHPSELLWNKMGMAFQQMFGLKEAERCYKRVLKLNSKNPDALNNLATVQDQMRNYGAAEKNYRKAIKLNANSAVLYKNLGTNLLLQHEYDEGSEAYKKALSLDPDIFYGRFGPKVNNPAPAIEHGTAAYFKARTCARSGLNDCAISFLIEAFNEGGATVKKVIEEPDFASLQGSPALTRLLANEQ